jgi:Rhs element Vgr protein
MANDQTIPEKVKGAAATFTVKIGGQAIPQTIQVYSVNVTREINRIPFAKLMIIDGEPSKTDFAVSSGAIFIPGKEIEIFAGHQSNEDSIFKGLITGHGISIRKNGSSQLKLECKDKAFKMTLGRKSAYYKDKKDSDIASDLVGKYKLTVGKIEATKRKHAEMIQFDTSDWDFLLERMDINGKLVLVNDGTVDIKSPDFSTTPVLTLQHGATIQEFDAEIDARNQYTAVKALGWDYSSQEIVEKKAAEPSKVKDNGNLTADQLAKTNGTNEIVLRHAGNISAEELQAWADACWQKSRMAKIRGRVSFDGFAKIKTGDLIMLQGLGDRFNGKVYASGVRHDIVNGGWVTSVQFGMDPAWFTERLPAMGVSNSLTPSIQGLHTGVVAQLEKDPAGEDRILIKIPMVNLKDEGVWARVATLDAGKNRGSFFRPDVGDEVIVGFINNDPRQAIVLGMLNSSKLPAPMQPKDNDNKEKGFFFSPSKMKILFNEEEKSMVFETSKGNKMTISEKAEGIALQDQNGNKLILNKDGITLESSKNLVLKAAKGDIEIEGKNVKQKAQAEFKAEGTGGVEITSSAMAKLKGSLVQIN